MLLTDSSRIGDVIFFPLLRPESSGKGKKKEEKPKSKLDGLQDDISAMLGTVRQELGEVSAEVRKRSAKGLRGLMSSLSELIDPEDDEGNDGKSGAGSSG